MTLDADDKLWLTQLVKGMASHQPPPVIVPRMSVKQFACAADLPPEVVRRKIRVREIPRNLVYGPPWKISPAALELFRVTPHEARVRLEAHNLLPASRPSQA